MIVIITIKIIFIVMTFIKSKLLSISIIIITIRKHNSILFTVLFTTSYNILLIIHVLCAL